MIIKRTKGKLNSDYKTSDMYKEFCKTSKIKISYLEYSKICRAINRKVVEGIIKNNMLFILPSRCGNISVRKYKMKLRERVTANGSVILNQFVDWKATKEMRLLEPENSNKVVYGDNDHSNGQSFKFVYNTYHANFKNKFLTGFKPLRKISRALAKEIKSNPDFDAFDKI